MNIRQTKKTNIKGGKIFYQYTLIQSLRIDGKSKQKTILYLGSQKYLADKEYRNIICKALEEKIYRSLFFATSNFFYDKLEDDHKKQIDIWYLKYIEKQQKQKDTHPLCKPANPNTATFEEIDTSSVNTSKCREVGAEWLCLKTAERIGINRFLESEGFSKKEIELALISIISRAVYPCSEHKTAQWLETNSALWELFKTIKNPPSRFTLYRIAEKLSYCFDDFTTAVYQDSVDLFNLKDTLMIFDLTNSYFEGRKLDSILSKFGRSKEKRNDCKIISFSAVVNSEGFLRQSKIYQGNIADTNTLLPMISEMKKSLNTSNLNEIIVMDAGITSEENLSQLRDDGQRYVCVSRTQLKDYQEYTSINLTQIEDKRGNKIELKIINSLDKPDKWMLVKSELKEKKNYLSFGKVFTKKGA